MRSWLISFLFCAWPTEQKSLRENQQFTVLVLHQTAPLTPFRFGSLGRVCTGKANMLWLLALSVFNHHTYRCLFILFHFTGNMYALKCRALCTKNQNFRAGGKTWDHLVSTLSFCRVETKACDERQWQTNESGVNGGHFAPWWTRSVCSQCVAATWLQS